jgi:hypothetical protein
MIWGKTYPAVIVGITTLLWPSLIELLALGLKLFLPNLSGWFIHPSMSSAMREIIMTPDWGIYQEQLSFRDFLFASLPVLVVVGGPTLILFWFSRSLALLAWAISLMVLAYFYLLNHFNPDAQGALVYLFGPIYAVGVGLMVALPLWFLAQLMRQFGCKKAIPPARSL